MGERGRCIEGRIQGRNYGWSEEYNLRGRLSAELESAKSMNSAYQWEERLNQ